jgi:hypothetical protein
MKKRKLDPKLQAWILARERYRLSHAHVQMAQELGMNPRKLRGLANHKQEPWKAPLPQFIEHLYEKRFGRTRPATVMSIEEHARHQNRKKAARREAKRQKGAAVSGAASRGRDGHELQWGGRSRRRTSVSPKQHSLDDDWNSIETASP